ncbi:excalibur calcium-binding domain-containing protein [Mycolicibacterium neoaurum]|uniref:excalibur calcium-binding domain-containing protein n=1 Tax=Mycolicibacterium neoaurum TaxID=1795 RepID=UPI00248B1A21|nr:excalibur calcium-binding domain-containing protein [Mycolicibacterium neoaurum]WBP96838.1 excalibur calcium-binding domain-containing protein [Mycolicibacterium neoaurum]WBS10524.1 excalibur calcium-binding domain-containing protein [Mycolicibacterium neoaurum]
MVRAGVIGVVLVGIVAAGPVPLANATPFKNCTQARQAGYEDIPSSSDYYGSWLDGDGDGIACEST